ncbi:helix-turn-helix domain-containing protein [Paenibacillus sp. sptzw28]|uniref:response regulator transcription factor n=1 Tax=Paenibacillus sp. sptzw28 TaxID=715179 RepID=UPI001C6F2A8E|nr:helix-turn-helix domain-containing protein [Paenibacillus sp. sptzw28]QYR20202.1 helix-turn-helix domain-containing protein [Paenibacillus sp. sptzw28]
MCKALIIDHQPDLAYWSALADWRACGYELCGSAGNAGEALSLIRGCSPDLIIVDIGSPVINGFELIRKIRQTSGKRIKCIAVSRQYRFALAQQAIRERFDRYLLKPVQKEEFQKVLTELRDCCDIEFIPERNDADKQMVYAGSAALARTVRQGGLQAAEDAQRLLDIGRDTKYRLVLLETVPDTFGRVRQGDEPSFFEHLAGAVEACGPASAKVIAFEDMPYRCGLLILREHEGDNLPFDAALKVITDRLSGLFPSLAVYAAKSDSSGLTGLRRIYRQLLEQRSVRRTVNRSRSDSPDGLKAIAEHTRSLMGFVEESNAKGIRASVESLYQVCLKTDVPERTVRDCSARIRGELLRRLMSAGADPTFPPPWLQAQTVCPPGISQSTPEAWAMACIQSAAQLAGLKAKRPVCAVVEAIDYIKRHCREKLQLQELAAQFHLNSIYLGQQLKKETGYQFNDYIHRLRIAEAQKLLRRTDMKMTDIAHTLGYHDQDYFADKFKALTKYSPSTYKKLCQEQQETHAETRYINKA